MIKKSLLPLALLVLVVAFAFSHKTYAQNTAQKTQIVQITAPRIIFTGTLEQLEAQKKQLTTQIQQLQSQLDALNKPYETISPTP